MVLRRIDTSELAWRGPRVEIDEAAVAASHDEKAVRARAVLEVFSDADRLAVGRAANATCHVRENERLLLITRLDRTRSETGRGCRRTRDDRTKPGDCHTAIVLNRE
jgi:hypothetical protein